eukprot:scaffold57835_cov17-Tisochrysis_lutea.AAC.1
MAAPQSHARAWGTGSPLMLEAAGQSSDTEATQDATEGGEEEGSASRLASMGMSSGGGAGGSMYRGSGEESAAAVAAAAAAAAAVAGMLSGTGASGAGSGGRVEEAGVMVAGGTLVKPVAELSPAQEAAMDLAREMRRTLESLGIAPGSVANAKQLLTSGGLADQVLEYRRVGVYKNWG